MFAGRYRQEGVPQGGYRAGSDDHLRHRGKYIQFREQSPSSGRRRCQFATVSVMPTARSWSALHHGPVARPARSGNEREETPVRSHEKRHHSLVIAMRTGALAPALPVTPQEVAHRAATDNLLVKAQMAQGRAPTPG